MAVHFDMNINRQFSCIGNRTYQRRDAFTLIELLVVISIVSLLVSILLPALGAARKSAQAIKCQSNLRQMGIANNLYSNDWNGYLVSARMVKDADITANPSNDWTTYWWYKLSVQFDYIKPGGFVCPSDNLRQDWSTGARQYLNNTGVDLPVSYGYSGGNGDYYIIYRYGQSGGVLNTTGMKHSPKRIEDYRGQNGPGSNPSTAFTTADFVVMQNSEVDGKGDNHTVLNASPSYGLTRMSARHADGKEVNTYHVALQGNMNAVFVDGHGKTLKAPFALNNNIANPVFASEQWLAGNFEP
ncbi:MAG TPA: hypothetical protein DCM28_20995 [Phycisphaerales bacterium]|nr:hypothetical protein [Phycisphaerales bacterium]HCD32414.1 hypothetical protein [Phycisphaerales bacterium]|tara:strand:+ start:889 stop:1785 length:897 start_codon:yes stop_codon:yes gene_type:complete